MNILAAVRRFAVEAAHDAARSDDPLADGLVDSLGFEHLLARLESRFRISFEEEDFVARNFDSVGAVVALVERKLLVRR